MALIITSFPNDIWGKVFLCVDQKGHYSLRAVAKFFYDSEDLHRLFLIHAFPEDKRSRRFRFEISINPPSWAELCRSRILAEQNLLNGLSRVDKSRLALDGDYFFVNKRKDYGLESKDRWLMPLSFFLSHDSHLPDIHYGNLEGLPIVKLTYGTKIILLRFDFNPTFTDKCYKITKIVLRKIYKIFIRNKESKIASIILLASGGALAFLIYKATETPLR